MTVHCSVWCPQTLFTDHGGWATLNRSWEAFRAQRESSGDADAFSTGCADLGWELRERSLSGSSGREPASEAVSWKPVFQCLVS